MASKSRKSQQPSLFYLVFFVLAAVVIGVVLKATQQTQLSQSRASYSPLSQCQSACSDARLTANSGACQLDCTAVIAGTMTCPQYCKENLKIGGQSALNECVSRCSPWAVDPCGPRGMCSGLPKECQTSCNSVKSGEKTCAQAFTQATARKRCISTFGEGN